MKLTPRYYQQDAVDECWAYLGEGKGRAPLLVEPTGSGKAFIISMLCQQANEFDPTVRIMVITDSRELVRQNYVEFVGLWPDAPAGIYSAGLNRRDIGARILFAGIQSIYKRAYSVQRCDILIIDECHMIPFKSDAMYQKLIADLRTINPNLVIIGMTATPFRGNGIPLVEIDELGKPVGMFDGIAHETTVAELIDEGYLCAPCNHRSTKGNGLIDATGVKVTGGEFNIAAAEAVAMDPETIRQAVDQIIEAGADRQAWKIFGVSTDHCMALHTELQARGCVGDVVFGHTDTERGKGTRDRIIGQFDNGALRYLISNMTLTKGFNVKRIDLIVLAYITKSVVKYVQTIGRGTRVLYAPGMPTQTAEQRREAIAAGPKPNCRVIDLGNNITRCGPFDDPFLKEKKGKGGGDAPYKTCPECECDTATATRLCPECGYEYPPPEPKISLVPDNKPILSQHVEPEWLPVSEVTYKRHSKQGGTDSLKVSYQVGLQFYHDWICLNHVGFPRSKAETWWRRRDAGPIPRTVADALEIADLVLLKPTHIRVKKDGKYTRIVQYAFEPVQSRNVA